VYRKKTNRTVWVNSTKIRQEVYGDEEQKGHSADNKRERSCYQAGRHIVPSRGRSGSHRNVGLAREREKLSSKGGGGASVRLTKIFYSATKKSEKANPLSESQWGPGGCNILIT